MNSHEVIEAVRHFLTVIDPQVSFDDRESALRAALDELATAYHSADAAFDERPHPDAPEHNYAQLRVRLETALPGLGLYNEALHVAEKLGESEMSTGDAIDDLADIAKDMLEVVFCWESTSQEDALWHFRFGFEAHWGRHLRGLQLYLHDRAY